MEPRPKHPPSPEGRRRTERARRHRNGVVAVVLVLIATTSLTVFAGSNVLCGTASGGVGFCSTAHPGATATGPGSSLPHSSPPARSPAPWAPGPSSALAPEAASNSTPPLGPSPAPLPPPRTPSTVVPLVLVPEDINDSTLAALATSVRPYLRSGDTIMLSSGANANGSSANPWYLNSQLLLLQPQLPKGIVYEARTGGLANVQTLVGSLSPSFRSVVYDYEPGFEPEFSVNFTTTMSNFIQFAQMCHLAGFGAVGYPYSLPLWGAHYSQDGWNYGSLLATSGIDQLQIQDQGALHTGMNIWNRSISTLSTQYGGFGLPASDISVQVSLASGVPNQVNVSTAYLAYENAVARGAGQVVLFWNLSSLPSLLDLLDLVRG